MPTKDAAAPSQQHQPADTVQGHTITTTLSETQSKYHKQFLGLVLPHDPTLEHPTAPLLVEYATNGCDATINTHWTMEMLEAAINRGAHPSALQPEPAAHLQA